MKALTPPNTSRSIVVVSPHPDDEALGTAGLLQEARSHGAAVHVIFATCGDGFKLGVSRYYHRVAPSPADFKNYGEMRMGESKAALATLGLPASDATFLGYPDRGTMAMWRDHWSPADPFYSQYSRSNKVVYEAAFHHDAPFCGQSLLSDLVTTIRANRPTDLYVTHPKDDHDDHQAVSAFTTLAFVILKQSGEPWTRKLKLHYFMVHHGDWPVPQGYHPREPLGPPAQLLHCDTQWNELALTPREENTKRAAIESYKSQLEMMSRFLESFVRRNEVFGEIPAQLAMMDAHDRDSWVNAIPAAIDPVGDSILLRLSTGTDIARIYARHDRTTLYVRLEAASRLVGSATYDFHIRATNLAGASPAQETLVSVSPRALDEGAAMTLQQGVKAAWRDKSLDLSIPLSLIGAPSDGMVFIDAMSRFGKMPCDHTGPRSMRIHIPR